MKKCFITMFVACAAMLTLNSCSKSKSTPEMVVDTMTELSKSLDNASVTEDGAVKALETATASLQKIAENVKANPEQAKKEMEEFEKSDEGKKFIASLESFGQNMPKEVTESEKVKAAFLKFMEVLSAVGLE